MSDTLSEKRECDRVYGNWADFFHRVTEPIFTAESCLEWERKFDKMFGAVFDRHVNPSRGPLVSLGYEQMRTLLAMEI